MSNSQNKPSKFLTSIIIISFLVLLVYEVVYSEGTLAVYKSHGNPNPEPTSETFIQASQLPLPIATPYVHSRQATHINRYEYMALRAYEPDKPAIAPDTAITAPAPAFIAESLVDVNREVKELEPLILGHIVINGSYRPLVSDRSFAQDQEPK